jgi:fermentation-respiration switch protein FrsA (DUF1100 family)
MILRAFLTLLGAWAAVTAFLYFAQRYIQYFPGTQPPGAPSAQGLPEMREIAAKTEDGLALTAWFAPPKQPGGRIVIFYHGNAGNIADRAVKARYFIEKGFGVYFCEYRGYGGNAGAPSEEGFYSDARSALRWLEAAGYTPAQFVLYGESIGTGVAVQMALETQPRALILEAPFSSAVAVAEKRYFFLPVALMMKDKYDSISKISRVKSSLLIIHGDEDGVIPLPLAQDLFRAANHPKEFITINGGHHNDLYDHHAGHVITEWLEKQA